MPSWIWEIMLFSLGFLAGLGAAFAGFLVVRMRRDASAEGRQLVDRLGPLGPRRLMAAISE